MDLMASGQFRSGNQRKSWKEDFISERKATEELVLHSTKVENDEIDVNLDKENWKEQIQEQNATFKSKLGNLSQIMDVSRAKKYQAELSRIPEESDILQEDLITYGDQQEDDWEDDALSLDLSISTYPLSQDLDLSTCDVHSEIERLQKQKSILEGRIQETKEKLDLPYRTRNQTNTYRLQLKRMAAKSETLDKKIEFETRNGERRTAGSNERGGWMKVSLRSVKHLSIVGLTSNGIIQKRRDSLTSSGDAKKTPVLFSVVRAAQFAAGSGKTKTLLASSPVKIEERNENDDKRRTGLTLNTQTDCEQKSDPHNMVKSSQAKPNYKLEDNQQVPSEKKGPRRVSVPRYDFPSSEEDRWAHLRPLAKELAQKKVKVATTKFLPPIPAYEAKRRPKTPKTETLIDENDPVQQEVRMILVPNRRRVAEGRAKMYNRQLEFAKFHDLTRKDIKEGIKYALEDCENTERVHRDKNLAIRRSRRHSLHMIGSLSRQHLYPPGTPKVKP